MAKAWPPGTTRPCPQTQTATGLRPRRKHGRPIPAHHIPHGEMASTIDLTVIPDLASKGPSPFQKPRDSKMPGPNLFYSWLLPAHLQKPQARE